MKFCSCAKLTVFMMILICLLPCSAAAYIGPGVGLSAIGAFLALIAGIIIALIGFIIYPLKRVLRKNNKKVGQSGGEQ